MKQLNEQRDEQAQLVASHLAAAYRLSGEDFLKLRVEPAESGAARPHDALPPLLLGRSHRGTHRVSGNADRNRSERRSDAHARTGARRAAAQPRRRARGAALETPGPRTAARVAEHRDAGQVAGTLAADRRPQAARVVDRGIATPRTKGGSNDVCAQQGQVTVAVRR